MKYLYNSKNTIIFILSKNKNSIKMKVVKGAKILKDLKDDGWYLVTAIRTLYLRPVTTTQRTANKNY